MYRWSKIPEEYLPEIISDVFDDKFYLLRNHDAYFNEHKRKTKMFFVDRMKNGIYIVPAYARDARRAIRPEELDPAGDAWCGNIQFDLNIKDFKSDYFRLANEKVFCVLMHKVKNNWCAEIDTIVCFMTGDMFDVFLVHPKDLIEWDPNEV